MLGFYDLDGILPESLLEAHTLKPIMASPPACLKMRRLTP